MIKMTRGNDDKRIKDMNSREEIIFKFTKNALDNTEVVEEGILNLLRTSYSEFLSDEEYFSIYSENLKVLVSCKKERKIATKTVIRVLWVVPTNKMLINNCFTTVPLQEIKEKKVNLA